jgi:DNA primase catalytic core
VPRARLIELNTAAAAFFAQHYPGSWAAAYLTERVGTDLAGDARFQVGYAPNSWTTLTSHLSRLGATEEEILAAGLGSRTSTERIIDRFRDRVMFGYTAADPDHPDRVEIRGFIGRRHPDRTDDDRAGPKYLNTADTVLFTKGQLLWGLADNQPALIAGAAPVLVEGPVDAIAVTLVGQDRYVGVAAVGTAFTDTQADLLRPYISTLHPTPDGRPRPPIIVATDADPAGQRAAHRAFWQLAARGEDPRQLLIADGKDPADYLHSHGPDALGLALQVAPPLAEQVTAARTVGYTHRLDSIEGRLAAMRIAADLLGARPPEQWRDGATRLAEQYHLAPGTVINEVLDAGVAWGDDPRGRARARLAERPPDSLPAPTARPPADPEERWAPLVASFAGDLTRDPHWPVLASHIDRAAATGYDVDHRLLVLTAIRPLDHRHPARDLDLRLAADHPDSLPPPDPATIRDDQAAAEAAALRRLTHADRDTAHRHARATPAPHQQVAHDSSRAATPPHPASAPQPERGRTAPGHRP